MLAYYNNYNDNEIEFIVPAVTVTMVIICFDSLWLWNTRDLPVLG